MYELWKPIKNVNVGKNTSICDRVVAFVSIRSTREYPKVKYLVQQLFHLHISDLYRHAADSTLHFNSYKLVHTCWTTRSRTDTGLGCSSVHPKPSRVLYHKEKTRYLLRVVSFSVTFVLGNRNFPPFGVKECLKLFQHNDFTKPTTLCNVL